eukprot:7901349-Alexandrium_andersonii.AAC.1
MLGGCLDTAGNELREAAGKLLRKHGGQRHISGWETFGGCLAHGWERASRTAWRLLGTSWGKCRFRLGSAWKLLGTMLL